MRFRLLVLLLIITGLLAPVSIAGAVSGTPAASQTAGFAHPEWLVDPSWVQAHRTDPTVKLVAFMAVDNFAKVHIPGSAQVDYPELELTDSSTPEAVAAWRTQAAKVLTNLGITSTETVVIYDGGSLYAARLWWVLDQFGHADKRILDGGLPAWIAANGDLAKGPSGIKPAATPYVSSPDDDRLATVTEVMAALQDPAIQIVDARPVGQWQESHIPGAVNIPYTHNASEGDRPMYRSAEELRAMYSSAGIDPARPVIPYCLTGVRSAVAYFTLRLIGYDHVALFTGSWSEWTADPSRPVEKP